MFGKRRQKISSIGIPMALYYYLYPNLWQTFFQQIGMITVLSEPTTLRTVEHAGLISEAEHCLALKIFDSHLSQLAGKVDTVFIPRILSMCREHLSCPKLGALPDVARAGILEANKVLTIEIDERKCHISETLLALGQILGISNSVNVSAVEIALGAMRIAQEELNQDLETCKELTLLVLGHPCFYSKGFG
ncbi:acyl-CoA dehydratase activase-related protein [Planctomycetota bacterium]